jgi:hypothetical protein
MSKNFSLGFALCGILFCTSSNAQASREDLIQRTESKPTRAGVSLGFSSFKLSTSDSRLTSLFGGVNFQFSINDSFGFLANFEQAFGTGSLIEIGGSWAFLGSHRPQKTTLELSGRPVVIESNFSPIVGRLEFFAAQYFINAGSRVVGLAGGGGGIAVDWQTPQGWGLTAFLRTGYTSNPELTAFPLKMGMTFNLSL